jgi:protocatechuate 3,4-dioxygenase beta subunit
MNNAEAVSDALATMLSNCTVCRAWAEQDEGPYHRDAQAERRDVVEDRDGVALQLGIRLARGGITQSRGAIVEIWQCDALGRYSGFPPPDSSAAYVADRTFLRGRQGTDDKGMVEFRTIYPGWYPGRTVHIHLMVHTPGRVLTSQLYFPDDVTDEVLAQAPYNTRPGRDTTNDTDEILSTGGEPAVLDIIPTDVGFRAAICLDLPAATTEAGNGKRPSSEGL